MQRRTFNLTLAASLATPAFLPADEKLAGRACRSVHLGYPAKPGIAFYAEITPKKTAPGTYFMVCGWNTGYFGMQELGNGKKVVLFSVWDPGEQNNPEKVAAAERVKLVRKDDDVRVGRFGGEGTGGQSFFDFDWQLDETYRFLVAVKEAKKRTEYTGYIFLPKEKKWKELVTFSRVGGWQPLSGHYSFIEDFRRNGESAKQARIALFGNVWTKPLEGDWQFVSSARFTADGNPATNIAASAADRFSLATGGETETGAARLNETFKLEKIVDQPPMDLPR